MASNDKDSVHVEMPSRMDSADFQNVVYKCCGLIAFMKWNIHHTCCFNSDVEERLINASVENCSECGYYTSDIVNLVRHMEKHHNASTCYVCALCRLPFAMKVALDCHVVHNHGSAQKSRNDYDRKYKLGVQ